MLQMRLVIFCTLHFLSLKCLIVSTQTVPSISPSLTPTSITHPFLPPSLTSNFTTHPSLPPLMKESQLKKKKVSTFSSFQPNHTPPHVSLHSSLYHSPTSTSLPDQHIIHAPHISQHTSQNVYKSNTSLYISHTLHTHVISTTQYTLHPSHTLPHSDTPSILYTPYIYNSLITNTSHVMNSSYTQDNLNTTNISYTPQKYTSFIANIPHDLNTTHTPQTSYSQNTLNILLISNTSSPENISYTTDTSHGPNNLNISHIPNTSSSINTTHTLHGHNILNILPILDTSSRKTSYGPNTLYITQILNTSSSTITSHSHIQHSPNTVHISPTLNTFSSTNKPQTSHSLKNTIHISLIPTNSSSTNISQGPNTLHSFPTLNTSFSTHLPHIPQSPSTLHISTRNNSSSTHKPHLPHLHLISLPLSTLSLKFEPLHTRESSEDDSDQLTLFRPLHTKIIFNTSTTTRQAGGTLHPSGGKVSATEPYIDPETPSTVTAYTGVTAIISCFVNNLGQRSVSWVRDRDIHVLTVGSAAFTNDDRFQPHHQDGSNEWALRLRSPTLRDSGGYECQVSTKPIISHRVYLKVLEPRAVLSGGPELYVKLGSTFQLNCSVVNIPSRPDFLHWYHNRKVVTVRKGKVGMESSEEGNGSESVLRITSASEEDSGNYICSPSNARNDSVTVQVINGEHPAAMQTNEGGISPNCPLFPLLPFVTSLAQNFWPRIFKKWTTKSL